jgi:hypothetical protein
LIVGYIADLTHEKPSVTPVFTELYRGVVGGMVTAGRDEIQPREKKQEGLLNVFCSNMKKRAVPLFSGVHIVVTHFG